MEKEPFFTTEEKKEFLSKYRLLLRSLSSFLEKEDIPKMKKVMAHIVAQDCYGRDKNGINGLLRNINTALIAAVEIGLKRTSVIAILLYRPVYKQVITIEEVKDMFGEDITLMIQRLLKTSDLYARNTAVNSENFHHLLFTFAEDVRVILLMIADRLCMMRLGKKLQEDDRIRLATEAAYLYAPLAHRLGLYKIKSELEDLSLKYTDRKQFDFIKKYMLAADEAVKAGEGYEEYLDMDKKEMIKDTENKKEMVNHPSHYNMGKYECIEVVKELVRDMKGIEPVLFFNAFKYLWRYKQKNGLQDLEKCEFYLKELIKLNKVT